MNSINVQMEMFIDFFKEIGNKKGVKWDDIVVKHEWNCAK